MRYLQKISLRCVFGVCVSFVCMTIVYNTYRPLSIFRDQSANEKITIERALQRIPICTSEDRSRHRALLFTLQAWNHFAQQNNIQYWIAFETLLGYVYHHALLPHQSSIDLFIIAHHTSQLVHLSPSNLPSDYELKIHPRWDLVDPIQRSYFISQGIDFLAPNARFIDTDDMVYLNIWPIYDYNPNETTITKNSRAMITAYDPNHRWKSTPKEWTFPLRECEFSGMKVWCPSEAEKMVDDMYGEMSVNMSSRRCINGSWVNSDKYRSTEKTAKATETTTTTATTSITSTSTSTTTTTIRTITNTKQSTTSETSSAKLNDSEQIEKTLEHIPTCTSNDRSRHRVLLTTLQAWARVAEKHRLEYWLGYGSLVGYVQRPGLLPHDLDIDVILMTDDVPKLINISKSNSSAEYEIKVQPQWYIPGYKNRSYFPDEGIHFIAPNARFIDRETSSHVDIFPGYNCNPHYAIGAIENQQSNNITIYNNREIKVLCPAEPEKLVESLFGIEALTKSDTKCVNGSWIYVH